ncbi:MAG TPA: hypothetical protein VH701_01315 [Vicinamibacterales bacterium]
MESQSPPKLRFAVGIFDSWERLRGGVRDFRTRGLRIDDVNCLGLLRVFARETTIAAALWHEPLRIRKIAFPGNSGPIACTSGPLAEHLDHAGRSGAANLREALATWLLPRHADYFQERLEAEDIQLWVHIANTDDERHACQSLLALSSGTVGVHDFISPRNGQNP